MSRETGTLRRRTGWAAAGLIIAFVGTWGSSLIAQEWNQDAYRSLAPVVSVLPALLLPLAIMRRREWLRAIGILMVYAQALWLVFLALFGNVWIAPWVSWVCMLMCVRAMKET